MTNIEYTYEVIAVDNAKKMMTLRYTAVNYPTVEVISPFPVLPDTVESMAHASAPLHQWRELTNQLAIPVVGESGSGKEVKTIPVVLSPL